MNRDILFRGKNIYDNRFYYGNYKYQKQDAYLNHSHYIDVGNQKYLYPVYQETIGQYTGLNDKNGVKIFEGDVLKLNTRNAIYVVFWHISCSTFFMKIIDGENITYCRFGDIHKINLKLKIIGNIHDNSELLTVGGGSVR